MVQREAVRLVVVDAEDRILLLQVQDATNPQFGTAWELPGGGMEAGETYTQAALRELREETGLEVAPENIVLPSWRRQVSYTYRGVRWQQDERILAVRVGEASPAIADSFRQGAEKDDVLDARWWSLQQISASGERFYPRSLPALLPRFLRGEMLEEQPESWP